VGQPGDAEEDPFADETRGVLLRFEAMTHCSFNVPMTLSVMPFCCGQCGVMHFWRRR
jgi:hypothetical protein